jgi:hypothetical protein
MKDIEMIGYFFMLPIALELLILFNGVVDINKAFFENIELSHR